MSKPTIAILGASANRAKFGNKAVRAYAARGYEVYPVNPNVVGDIEGHPVYTSIRDVPVDRLDRVSLYVPPAVGIQLLPELASKTIGELWLNPGAESPALIAKARALGLPVVIGCSIVDIGVSPHTLD